MAPITSSSNSTDHTQANDGDLFQSIEPETADIAFMDSKLYWDAAKGIIDNFKEDKEVKLDQIMTPSKNSVLHVYITSSETGQTNFVEEILEICPELLMQPNANDDIPLHVAARYGHEHIVKVLIDHAKALDHDRGNYGLDDLESGSNSSTTIYVGAAKEMLRKTNKENDTSFHEAVRFGHLGVVRILIEEDPDYLYADNGAGESPLYMAAERGYRDLVNEILLKCSSVVAGGPNNRTALHAATIAKDKEMTRNIIFKMEHLSLTKQADDKGWTPLHYAVDLNYLWIAKMLLLSDKYVAYIRDKEDCCELVDNKGWNVLHFAVQSENYSAVREILKAPPLSYLLNRKDNEGNTPFHYVSSTSISKKFLARPGLDKLAFNKHNQNALDVASTSTRRVLGMKFVKSHLRKVGLRPRRRIISSPSKNREESEQKNEKNDLNTSRKEKAREASLIVGTLIATVTFTAGFTLPGGYVSDKGPLQGTAVLRKNSAFQAFVITNMIAFVLSSVAVLSQISMLLMSKNQHKAAVFFERAVYLILWAMGAMVLALITGMFAVLEPSLLLAIAVCIIGLFFFDHFYPICKFSSLRWFKFGSTF
ncbi:Transmembrane protein [Parasponia andersonii]|uniref:Transmembrane protein n=1 Tax=Parasponia andersonii TaxID=3476 RepID=A0A2P5BD68_PARAD|nr:Transmembrane protein [Parasponia andersonii]